MIYQAPWKLKGEGIVITHRIKKSWILKNGLIPIHLHQNFKGGLAFTMLVDYHESDCGPYKELLFIPGFFLIKNRYRLMITKIYVNSEDSISSGRNNWGIPKEFAKITWQNFNNEIIFEALQDDQMILKAKVKSNKFAFPVTTKISPFNMHQEMDNKSYVFKPVGKGKSAFSKLKEISISKNHFPNIQEGKLVNCVHIKKFNMSFPTSKIESL